MTAQVFVDLMTSQGVKMTPGKKLQVRRQLKQAILDDRFFEIERKGKSIGFLTWSEVDGAIFINNLFIVDRLRNIGNLLYTRKIFRERFPAKRFHWNSRKHNREMHFKS